MQKGNLAQGAFFSNSVFSFPLIFAPGGLFPGCFLFASPGDGGEEGGKAGQSSVLCRTSSAAFRT